MAKSNKQINKEAGQVESDDSSPAVVAYRMGRLEKVVEDGFKEHNSKLEELTNSFSTKQETNAVSLRVASLESDRKWIVRLVVGAVLFALLALLGVGLKLN
jgi:hypothetical protein